MASARDVRDTRESAHAGGFCHSVGDADATTLLVVVPLARVWKRGGPADCREAVVVGLGLPLHVALVKNVRTQTVREAVVPVRDGWTRTVGKALGLGRKLSQVPR